MRGYKRTAALLLLLAPLVMALLLKPAIQIYAWFPKGHRNKIIENKFGDLNALVVLTSEN